MASRLSYSILLESFCCAMAFFCLRLSLQYSKLPTWVLQERKSKSNTSFLHAIKIRRSNYLKIKREQQAWCSHRIDKYAFWIWIQCYSCLLCHCRVRHLSKNGQISSNFCLDTILFVLLQGQLCVLEQKKSFWMSITYGKWVGWFCVQCCECGTLVSVWIACRLTI